MRYTTKIASFTGQKWAGVFNKMARRLAIGGSRNISENDSGRVSVRTDIFDGYVGKSTRRKDAVSTVVIDPPGRYATISESVRITVLEEGGFAGLSVSDVDAGLPRDIFNPALDYAPPERVSESPISSGSRFWTYYTYLGGVDSSVFYPFYMSSPTEGGGIGATQAARLSAAPALDQKLQVVDERTRLSLFVSYVAGSSTALLTAYQSYQPSHVVTMTESYLSGISAGYSMTSRYVIDARITRQLPYITSARDHGRMASCGVMTTNPLQAKDEEFPHRGGEVGLYFHVAYVSEDRKPPVFEISTLKLKDMDLGLIEPEEWDSDLPWIQEYTIPDSDPPEKAKVIYQPAGPFLSLDPPQALSDMMSCAFGSPTACIKEESVEFLVDLRVARTWVDKRGLDFSVELNPITVQTQSALLLVTLPGFKVDSLPGAATTRVISSDASGAVKNGCYKAFGGSDESAHRIWRTVWSGNSAGKHVALISVVKHGREETASPGVELLRTAQSSFSGAPTPTDDPVAISFYIDGTVIEKSAKELGYSLRSNGNEDLEQADYDWTYRANKCATVAGERNVFFTAYSYPNPSEILLINWDLVSGSLSVVRRLPARLADGKAATSALSCYHQQEIRTDGKEASPACILLRHGNISGAGWVELTKDYGKSWKRIAGSDTSPSKTPELGVYYLGAQLAGVNYGEVFSKVKL